MENVDVAIIGGGIIGLTLACGLQGSGLRVTILEQCVPKSLSVNKHSMLHVSAINTASKNLLIKLNIWSDIITFKTSYYHSIEMWDKDGFGCVTFNNNNLDCDHLGYIVENSVIYEALWQKVQQCADIKLVAPVILEKVMWGENEAFLTLQDSKVITARLVVGADGVNSWLRNKAEIPLTFCSYPYHALVATVRTDKPHGYVMRQVVHNSGDILTFMPLSDTHLCYIVWSLVPDNAQQMRDAKLKTFNQALCIAVDNRLGLCSLEGERQMFPLTNCYAQQFAAHRLVLVGNAAYTIHPLLGQGANKGFTDVAELVKELRRLHCEGKDIGQYIYLRRYERSRKYSAAIMLTGIQIFNKLFTGYHPVNRLLRNFGLFLVETTPCVKSRLLRQVMGLNNLPE